MHITNTARFELKGHKMNTVFVIHTMTTERSSRGDHGMGGGDYTTYHYEGWVSAKSLDGKFLAVCRIEFSTEQSFRLSQKEISLRIKPEQVEERHLKDYADFVGEKAIFHFSDDQHGDFPNFPLREPDFKALIGRGIILDVGDQVHMALK